MGSSESNFPQSLENLSLIPPYKAGAGDLFGKEDEGVLKLSSNELLAGPSPEVVKVLKDCASKVHYYPPIQSLALRKKIGTLNSISVDEVILGNGSNELIQMAILAYVGPGHEVLIPNLTFSMYEIYGRMVGREIRKVEVKGDFSIDLERIRASVRDNTRMIVLTNPNNPTGSVFHKGEFEKLMKSLPSSILVLLDEAYIDFVEPDEKLNAEALISQSGAYPNLFIIRTFSKAFGLAALRIGYGIGSKELILNLHKVRQPFNLNGPAQLAAIAALDNLAYVQGVSSDIINVRKWFQVELAKRSVSFIESQANFVMIKVGDGQKCAQWLKSKKIFVRALESFGLEEYIRVTLSIKSDMLCFLEAFDEWSLCNSK